MNDGFVYKQRYNSRNLSETPHLNSRHLIYIATRPGAEYNRGCAFGLWGNILTEDAKAENIMNLDKAVEHIHEISHEKTVYRSVLSLSEEDAKAKDFDNREKWQQFISDNINVIAKNNDIELNNIRWCASFHKEETHPHIHIMFYDASDDIREEYISPTKFEIRMEHIRADFAKIVFTDELQAINSAVDNMQKFFRENIKGDLISDDELLAELGINTKQEFKVPKLSDKTLKTEAQHLQNILDVLPPKSSLKYQYLKAPVKAVVDDMIESILTKCYFNEYTQYLDTVAKRSQLYGNGEKSQAFNLDKAKKELYKVCGNQILKFIKENHLLSVAKSDDSFESLKNELIEKALLDAAKANERVLSKLDEGLDVSLNKAIGLYLDDKDIKAKEHKMVALSDDKTFAEQTVQRVENWFAGTFLYHFDNDTLLKLDENIKHKIEKSIDEHITDDVLSEFKDNIYKVGFNRAKSNMAYGIINKPEIAQSIKDIALIRATENKSSDVLSDASQKYADEVSKEYVRMLADKVLLQFKADGNFGEFKNLFDKEIVGITLKGSTEFNSQISNAFKYDKDTKIAKGIVDIANVEIKRVTEDKGVAFLVQNYAELNARYQTLTSIYTDELVSKIKDYKIKKENLDVNDKDKIEISDADKMKYFRGKSYGEAFSTIENKVFDRITFDNLSIGSAFFNEYIFGEAIPDAVENAVWVNGKDEEFTLNESIVNLFSKANLEVTDFKKVFGYFRDEVYKMNDKTINAYLQIGARYLAQTSEYTDELVEAVKRHKARKDNVFISEIRNLSDDDKKSYFKSSLRGDVYKSIRTDLLNSLTENNMAKISEFYQQYLSVVLKPDSKTVFDMNVGIQSFVTALNLSSFTEQNETISNSEFAETIINDIDDVISKIFETHSEVVTSYAEINARYLARTTEYTDELIEAIKEYKAKKEDIEVDDVEYITDDDKLAYFKSKTYGEVFKNIKESVLNSLDDESLSLCNFYFNRDIDEQLEVTDEWKNTINQLVSSLDFTKPFDAETIVKVIDNCFDSLLESADKNLLSLYCETKARELVKSTEFTDELIEAIKEYKAKKENIEVDNLGHITDDDKLAYFKSKTYGEVFKKVKSNIVSSLSADNTKGGADILNRDIIFKATQHISSKSEKLNEDIKELLKEKIFNSEKAVQLLDEVMQNCFDSEIFSSEFNLYITLQTNHLVAASEYTDELIEAIKEYKAKKENIEVDDVEYITDEDKTAYFRSKTYSEILSNIKSELVNSLENKIQLANKLQPFIKDTVNKSFKECFVKDEEVIKLYKTFVSEMPKRITPFKEYANDEMKDILKQIQNKIFETADIQNVINTYIALKGELTDNVSLKEVAEWKSAKDSTETKAVTYTKNDVTDKDVTDYLRSKAYSEIAFELQQDILNKAWADKGWREQYIMMQIPGLMLNVLRLFDDREHQSNYHSNLKGSHDLSKSAKRELMLKLRDMGYER